ncbi:winged helix-turn-helix transcriptional regulator [Candidatus Poriferisodalis sp.]|uniref:winged helix-turn-helix transcriptional regulator n=1 Tax=Candidatus Poriferisodalis sp. TaxID=3101277 RepID=UPI003B522EF1
MKTATTGQPSCSIQATLDIVGDRWTLLILRDLFRGVRRFSAMQHDLGIARNMLADRLSRLVDADVVAKVPYQHRPVRFDYVLTHKGLDLSNSLLALMAWGDRWCQDGDAPTVLLHADCGTPLELATRCPSCDEPVSPARIRSRASHSDTAPARAIRPHPTNGGAL